MNTITLPSLEFAVVQLHYPKGHLGDMVVGEEAGPPDLTAQLVCRAVSLSFGEQQLFAGEWIFLQLLTAMMIRRRGRR